MFCFSLWWWWWWNLRIWPKHLSLLLSFKHTVIRQKKFFLFENKNDRLYWWCVWKKDTHSSSWAMKKNFFFCFILLLIDLDFLMLLLYIWIFILCVCVCVCAFSLFIVCTNVPETNVSIINSIRKKNFSLSFLNKRKFSAAVYYMYDYDINTQTWIVAIFFIILKVKDISM